LKDFHAGKLDIHLPEGIWFDYDTGEKFKGPKLLKDFPMPLGKTPCFIGGKGIFVTRTSDASPLTVHSYPIGKPRTNHVIHHPDGVSTSKIAWAGNGTNSTARDLTSGKALAVSQDAKTGALSFEILPGHHYLIE
jgi:alpha-glucosidase (family GH31 glycosyl hydrolase)